MVCGKGDVRGRMPVFGRYSEGEWVGEEGVYCGNDSATFGHWESSVLYMLSEDGREMVDETLTGGQKSSWTSTMINAGRKEVEAGDMLEATVSSWAITFSL